MMIKRIFFCRHVYYRLIGLLLIGLTLMAGPALGQQQKSGNNDWWVAIINDRVEVVRHMLENGADANAVGTAGQPPIMLAIREGAWGVYDVLLNHPATAYNAINTYRESPLMYLAVIGDTERARDIIRRGAMVNRPGWTPLHYAASTGQIEMTHMLLELGAEVNARAFDGTTPLMMAAYAGSEEVVRVLLAAGADAHLRTVQDYDVVDWAGFKQHTWLGAKLQNLIDRQLGDEGLNAVFDPTPVSPSDVEDSGHGTSRYFDPDHLDTETPTIP